LSPAVRYLNLFTPHTFLVSLKISYSLVLFLPVFNKLIMYLKVKIN
jgi:hypothetical protein